MEARTAAIFVLTAVVIGSVGYAWYGGYLDDIPFFQDTGTLKVYTYQNTTINNSTTTSPLKGVSVSILGTEFTGQTAITTENGQNVSVITFNKVPVGSYDVIADYNGTILSKTNVTITKDTTTTEKFYFTGS
jgi:hypothetical protein